MKRFCFLLVLVFSFSGGKWSVKQWVEKIPGRQPLRFSQLVKSESHNLQAQPAASNTSIVGSGYPAQSLSLTVRLTCPVYVHTG